MKVRVRTSLEYGQLSLFLCDTHEDPDDKKILLWGGFPKLVAELSPLLLARRDLRTVVRWLLVDLALTRSLGARKSCLLRRFKKIRHRRMNSRGLPAAHQTLLPESDMTYQNVEKLRLLNESKILLELQSYSSFPSWLIFWFWWWRTVGPRLTQKM